MTSASSLDELRSIVASCTACPLHETRSLTVFGRGPPTASIMIVGESPGEDEDKIGEPFVGRAGQHLSRLLQAAAVPEEELYVCNTLKCRPPENKFPTSDHIPMTCRQYLLRQIELIKPTAVILTGKQALRYLLLHGTPENWEPLFPWINKQIRRRDTFGDIRFMVCYHPSYLLRSNNDDDEEAWIQAVSQLWSYVQHRRGGTAPAPAEFRDIKSVAKPHQMSRNLFGKTPRKM